jgi:hypothetical protein
LMKHLHSSSNLLSYNIICIYIYRSSKKYQTHTPKKLAAGRLAQGGIKEAAEKAGVSEKTLHAWLKRLKLLTWPRDGMPCSSLRQDCKPSRVRL